jgi:hypothetical protein
MCQGLGIQPLRDGLTFGFQAPDFALQRGPLRFQGAGVLCHAVQRQLEQGLGRSLGPLSLLQGKHDLKLPIFECGQMPLEGFGIPLQILQFLRIADHPRIKAGFDLLELDPGSLGLILRLTQRVLRPEVSIASQLRLLPRLPGLGVVGEGSLDQLLPRPRMG